MSRPTRVPQYLKEELAELRKDKARLDWLESIVPWDSPYVGISDYMEVKVIDFYTTSQASEGIVKGSGFRDAIDAAMEAE